MSLFLISTLNVRINFPESNLSPPNTSLYRLHVITPSSYPGPYVNKGLL